MEINWSRNSDVLVAKPVGRIYSSDYLEWQSLLEAGIGRDDHKLVVDFGQVPYIASAGLRILLVTAKRFTGPGRAFAICRLTRPLGKVMKSSGFDAMLSVHDSVEEAVAAIGG